jgi:transglutaminase-like putative cysteine protease
MGVTIVQEAPLPSQCLQPGPAVDSDHPAVVELSRSLVADRDGDIDKAISLYYWSRDRIRYNPYNLELSVEGLSASRTLATGEGWCVAKAILLAALCRAAGIPARLGYADVRNHLSTERLRQAMQTDVFYFHGYTSIYLQGRWVKATPAFNVELCDKFGLRPLEFDGLEDSLYHEFDVAGKRHMEYLNDRGEYLEPPLEEMIAVFRRHYPAMMEHRAAPETGDLQRADWESDVAREVAEPSTARDSG